MKQIISILLLLFIYTICFSQNTRDTIARQTSDHWWSIWGSKTLTFKGSSSKIVMDGKLSIKNTDSSNSPQNLLWMDNNGIIKRAALPASEITGLTSTRIPKATSSTTIANGLMTDNGTQIQIDAISNVSTLKFGSLTNALIFHNDLTGEMRFSTAGGGYFMTWYPNSNERMRLYTSGQLLLGTTTLDGNLFQCNGSASFTGKVGIFQSTPTAYLHLASGTTTAGTAPLKLTSGANLATPENGAVEFDGTNYFATSGSTRYTLAKTLTATATLDFGNTVAGAKTDLTVTVTGAVDGDAVSIGVPNSSTVANGAFSAWVSAANTITIRFSNNDLSTSYNPATGAFRVVVLKY